MDNNRLQINFTIDIELPLYLIDKIEEIRSDLYHKFEVICEDLDIVQAFRIETTGD